MAEAFYKKAMGHQRPDRAAASWRKAKKVKHVQEMEAARMGMAAAQARIAASIKHAQEIKLAADLRRAESRKKRIRSRWSRVWRKWGRKRQPTSSMMKK
ncbi:MAG: hypothetical protein ALECFALPRED_004383 [Alectoria fallacina]|uniref:Uncharacterized protein n=1 Tax=Alectoria fallacina TaxID=1903189 RepID=A0A8H3EJJ6_9LECA|nr:MAG: hypothetical protein ALECFALPRED_004383 [Alectoria fallacina]